MIAGYRSNFMTDILYFFNVNNIDEPIEKYKDFVTKAMNGQATAKGVLVVTPEQVIVTTPGKDNKKQL